MSTADLLDTPAVVMLATAVLALVAAVVALITAVNSQHDTDETGSTAPGQHRKDQP